MSDIESGRDRPVLGNIFRIGKEIERLLAHGWFEDNDHATLANPNVEVLRSQCHFYPRSEPVGTGEFFRVVHVIARRFRPARSDAGVIDGR
jgi:hypothetical protein